VNKREGRWRQRLRAYVGLETQRERERAHAGEGRVSGPGAGLVLLGF